MHEANEKDNFYIKFKCLLGLGILAMYRRYNLRKKGMKFEILKYLRLTHNKFRCKKLER